MSEDPGPPFFAGSHPHNLDAIVDQFGSAEAAFSALVAEVVEAMQIGHATAGKFQFSVLLRGHGITVRGWISESGEVDVATAFVFRNAPGGPDGPLTRLQ